MYRFVDKNTPFDFLEYLSKEEYEIHLRVVRVKVDNSSFEYLITNLPADKYDIGQLKLLYWIRWKIETSIQHLKKVIGAEAFHCRSLVNVSHELLARLVKYNFCSAVSAIAIRNIGNKKGKKHLHQVNFSLAIKKCHDFLCQKESEKPINIVRIIEKFTLPVRNGRKFERKKQFQKPMTFLYRH
ncbi:MAG: transposase [Eubacteriales bacterium]|nr:transposase [Eubacteriales bacterium]